MPPGYRPDEWWLWHGRIAAKGRSYPRSALSESCLHTLLGDGPNKLLKFAQMSTRQGKMGRQSVIYWSK